jgi:hypothetical protein
MTMVFLGVSLLTLSSLMWWTSSNAKVTQQNELFTTGEAAAEAYTEEVVATLDRDWTYGQSLQAASVYANLAPPNQTNWPIQFQFSDGSGNNNKVGFTLGTQFYNPALGSTFANLAGYQSPCTITATATTVGELYTVSATVQQVVQATIIPLFQFAIFYNLDMDVSPGQPMNIGGSVFCNSTIWMWPYAATVFSNDVHAAGWVTNHMQPYDQQSSSGNVAPTYMEAGQPVSKVDSLTLPIGTNNSASAVEGIINLPVGTNGAPNSGAYTTNGQMYLFNESDLIISNSAAGLVSAKGTNITIWFQDNQQVNPLTLVTNDYYALKTGGSTNVVSQSNSALKDATSNVLYASYSFVTNVSFYDYREADTVQAVQVDVSLLNKWLTNTAATGGNSINKTSYNDKGRGINSIYIYNNVPTSSTQLPAVRMINGAQLPYTTDPNGTSGRSTGGLTVTTPQPLYVKGNYNVQTASSAANASAGTADTTYTYPAALMGDAITVLSSSWSDAYTSGTALSSRPVVNTTINAACLEGIVQSTNVGSNLYYSGGIENFLRLEENWSTSYTLTYNGSIVVMFPSIYATNFWQVPGNYYNPPTRHWGFDVNFTTPSKLPPLTPKFYKIIRYSWKDY